MKNYFNFILRALFVLMFKILSWLLGHVEKWLDLKDGVNFKIYDVTTWLTKHGDTHIGQYLKKKRQLGNEIWSVNKA